jgi:hypothetical protein
MNTEVNLKLILANEIISTSFLSNPDLIQDIYYVYSNPAKIESIEVIKLNNVVNKVRNCTEYKLNSHRIIVKQRENSNQIISDELSPKSIQRNTNIGQKISENLDACLLKVLEQKFTVRGKINFFKRTLKTFFRKPTPVDLVNNFEGNNWIITTPEIGNELKSHPMFSLVDDRKEINHLGDIGQLSVFTNSSIESGVVYSGNVSSLMAIINKDIKVEEFDAGDLWDKGFKINIEYLVFNHGVDKWIIK